MKTKCLSFLFLSFLFMGNLAFSQSAKETKSKNEGKTYVVISTDYGNMKVLLYNETPLHRDNFIKLISEGYYNGLLFHRVINNFMIQGGDPNSRNAEPGAVLGNGGPDYLIPAEFVPGKYHKKGALAAARTGGPTNPEKKSSASQFYLVQGQVFTVDQIPMIEKQLNVKLNDEQIKLYTTVGGVPWLDNEYTIFGEVVEGLEVIDKIAEQKIDKNDRPLQDIKMKITIVNLQKK